MKRQLGTCLIAMLMLGTTSIYAGEIGIQNNQLTIPVGEKHFSVQLNVKEDELYAGAEMGIDLTQGLEIKNIDYGIDQDYMNVGPVQNSAGTYYFGYFDGENKFSGNYTITLDVEKVDETIKEASISLKALNITRLDDQKNVETDKKSLDQQVYVMFKEEQAPIKGETVILEEIPDDRPQQKEPVAKPTVDKKPLVEPEETIQIEEKVEPEQPKEEVSKPIEVESIVDPAQEPEKEIVEVKTPLPYGKMTLGAILIAALAFVIGRITKKMNVPKEDKHDQQL